MYIHMLYISTNNCHAETSIRLNYFDPHFVRVWFNQRFKISKRQKGVCWR